MASQPHEEVGETHAVVPQLKQFLTQVAQNGIDEYRLLVGVHTDDSLHYTDLRRRHCPAGFVAGAEFEDDVHQVGYYRPEAFHLMFFNGCTSLVKPRISERQDHIKLAHDQNYRFGGNGFPRTDVQLPSVMLYFGYCLNQTSLFMRRRSFLNTSGSFLISATALPLIINACKPIRKPDEDMDVQVHPDDFPLNEATIADLQALMKSGKKNSGNLTQLYLDRIARIDPKLRSVLQLNPDALAEAKALDTERAAGKVRGPLHGIPVLVKDNVDIAGKMMNTAGSLALEGNIPEQDAGIIVRLRDAGAVILGKTNLSEWANFRSNWSSSGWSSRGGQTANPYDLSRNPCGSSSGTGSAVSANLCAVGIGTETNGSIICPSSINGLVGIKPTIGLWSRSGIIPISHTQDTAGPMTRTVTDAAILLGALAGPDPRDPVTQTGAGKTAADYTAFLNAKALSGKRLGVERSYMKKHPQVDELLAAALKKIRDAGGEVVEVDFLEKLKGIGSDEYTVLLYEFKDGVNKYLADARAQVKNLAEVIAFNKAHASSAMPIFGQDILEEAQAKGDLKSEEYRKAVENVVNTSRRAIDELMVSEKLDAICAPSYGPSWCTDHVNGDYSTGYGFSGPAAMAGYPHITVPMGFVSGLPIGFSFVGRAFSEGSLIGLAFAFESIIQARRSPQVNPA